MSGLAVAADAWRLDPVHTRVLFKVDHAGFSQALGLFPDVQGELRFDPADWASARLEVRIPLARLQIGDDGWRDKLLTRAFFDAADFPEARFVSTRVEPVDAENARVFGQLTLRGVEREIMLTVRLNRLARHPLTFRRTAGFSASAELDRRDFGMDAWPNVIGQTVQLEIQAEATRTRNDQEHDDADPEHR
ncbi:MAG: YceI family protein [Rhizobium sp.]|nr:YceI family protein [Rhizobium sp.]